MMSVKQAQKILFNNFDRYRVGRLPVLDALGFVLAEDIISPDRLPRFDQSAMDGYAIKSDNTKLNHTIKLKIIARIFPGNKTSGLYINDYECAEITTGAPMPAGADAVVPVEETIREGGFIYIKRKISKFENVRFAGKDVDLKKKIAGQGNAVTPRMTGLLSALGIVSAKVFLPPSAGIITTGSELASPDKKINKYRIRNSNMTAIQALLKSSGITCAFKKTFPDKQGVLFRYLKNTGRLPDILIITGGVSVGRHDYVKQELERFGVKRLFWKVSQKPGKPLYAGIKNNTIFFGLPGNPAAVFLCFYLYILPVINRYMRKTEIFLPEISAVLKDNVNNDIDRTVFLRAHYNKKGQVKLLKGQESHMLFSFARANSLMMLKPLEKRRKGEKIKILLY